MMNRVKKNKYLDGHVGERLVNFVVGNGDGERGLSVRLIKAWEGLAGVCWLMVSGSNFSESEMGSC